MVARALTCWCVQGSSQRLPDKFRLASSERHKDRLAVSDAAYREMGLAGIEFIRPLVPCGLS
jgi:hypothetical protein